MVVKSDLRICSLHCGLFSAAKISSMDERSSLVPLRSSSVSLQVHNMSHIRSLHKHHERHTFKIIIKTLNLHAPQRMTQTDISIKLLSNSLSSSATIRSKCSLPHNSQTVMKLVDHIYFPHRIKPTALLTSTLAPPLGQNVYLNP